MSTASKTIPQPADKQLKEVLNDLVLAFNHKRQSILDHYGVIETDIEIIRYLMENDQKKMKELGEKFDIKLSTLTSIIDKLEKSKLVKRKNSKKDRRVIYIHLSSKAETLMTDLEQTNVQIGKVIDGSLDKEEQDSLIKGLDVILTHLKSM